MRWRLVPHRVAVLFVLTVTTWVALSAPVAHSESFDDLRTASPCGSLKVVNGVYLPLGAAECAEIAARQAEAAANQAILDDLAAQGLTEGVDDHALRMAVEQGGAEEALALAETIQAAQAEAAANPGQKVNWSYEGTNWAMGSSVSNPIQAGPTVTAPPTTAPPPPPPTTEAPAVAPDYSGFTAEQILAASPCGRQKVVNGVYLPLDATECYELDQRGATYEREQEVRDAARAAATAEAANYPGRQACTGWEIDGRTGQECFTATVPTTTIATIAASPPPTTAAPIENDLSDDPGAYTGWSHEEIIAASPCGSQKVVNNTYMPLGSAECFQRELNQWRNNTAVEAQAAADAAARENPGVRQCASWTAGDQSGQACSIETRLAPGEGFLTHQAPDPEGTPIVDGEPVPCGTADWDNPLCYADGVVPAKGGSVYRPDGDIAPPTTTTTVPPTTTTTVPPTTTTTVPPTTTTTVPPPGHRVCLWMMPLPPSPGAVQCSSKPKAPPTATTVVPEPEARELRVLF